MNIFVIRYKQAYYLIGFLSTIFRNEKFLRYTRGGNFIEFLNLKKSIFKLNIFLFLIKKIEI